MNNSKDKITISARYCGTVLFLPLSLLYMETVFHIYMKLNMIYFPVFLCFCLSAGFLCACLGHCFPDIVNKIIHYICILLFTIIYCVEIVCKTVLSQYYQLLSSSQTALNNHLSDYSEAIIEGIIKNIPAFILLFVPFILLTVLCIKCRFFRQQKPLTLIISLEFFVLFHILGILSLHLPYTGALTPDELYTTDTEIESQVEQLGMFTMLRLDIKHSLFGVSRNVEISSSDLEAIGNAQMPVLESSSDDSDANAQSPNGSDTDNGNSNNSNSDSNDSDTQPETFAYDTSPNILNLDFDGLSASTSNTSVQWLNDYFQSVPSTDKNEYTGMFEGYNVIFITAEGFSGYMIDEELTPTLYKMTHEGFVFNNFYTPLHYTSTTNGECQNLLGLYPKNGEPQTMTAVGTKSLSMPFTLANQLNNLGYTSIGYHFNGNMYGRRLSHPQIGYDWHDSDSLTLERDTYGNVLWPQSDTYMITETFDEYVDQQPFNIYYMSISGHMPYSQGGNAMSGRNWSMVENLSYSYTTKAYLAAHLELEKGLTELVNRLEDADIADNTLIIVVPDHIPYFDVDVLEELTGEEFGSSEDTEYIIESRLNFEIYKSSLIIWSASMTETIEIDKICGQVDILPTVSNLLGLDYDSRLLTGTDILSDSQGLVIFSSRSWKSDYGFYNSHTGTFTPADGISMTQENIDNYVESMNTAVEYKLKATVLIQDTNYYQLILPDGVS